MADLYDGKSDARQATEPLTPTRFRPRYRQLTDEEKLLHDNIKNLAESLAASIEQIKPGRYRSLAITSLEESIMWAIKELTS